jgi:hypothetical protein
MSENKDFDMLLGLSFHAEGEVIKGPGEGVPNLGQSDDKE